MGLFFSVPAIFLVHMAGTEDPQLIKSSVNEFDDGITALFFGSLCFFFLEHSSTTQHTRHRVVPLVTGILKHLSVGGLHGYSHCKGFCEGVGFVDGVLIEQAGITYSGYALGQFEIFAPAYHAVHGEVFQVGR